MEILPRALPLLPLLVVAASGQHDLDKGGVFPPPASQRALGGQWSVDPATFKIVAGAASGSARLQRALTRYQRLTFDYGPAAPLRTGAPSILQRLVVNVASGSDALTRYTDESYPLQIASGSSPHPQPAPPGPPPPPVPPPPPAKCSTETSTVFNTTFSDGSGPRTAANASECCDICGSDPACKAYSFQVDATVSGNVCRWATLTHW